MFSSKLAECMHGYQTRLLLEQIMENFQLDSVELVYGTQLTKSSNVLVKDSIKEKL